MILGILQARMSSTRLPGKVLKNLLGQPMIIRQIERISRSESIDHLVVATSDQASDDVLVSLLEGQGIEVRRGPLENVAQRFLNIVLEYNPEHFVRLTADCPLADPQVIDLVVSSHVTNKSDYSSVGLTRTFQHGLDVEVVRNNSFIQLFDFDLNVQEKEHVTMGIYNRPDIFNINEVIQSPDQSELRWTVDEPEDFTFVQAVYNELYSTNPSFTTSDVMKLLASKPELNRTETNYIHELEAKKA